ncbi:[trimethylamine--corrinoid protein] Co-methyltransferase [Sporomusa sp.]|uniref:[trimethylamine--corrinoid protein] Co-methyltransferase n=1 Tax=Sporomusa sp. TaxID=2078658 RepID=UPI002C09A0FC|nr:trimethylamine methyltransferase family protein [Sporomusa sp.]HWR45860.1 trimethylamine methyltransferase family protein [Sporomusa sp.]
MELLSGFGMQTLTQAQLEIIHSATLRVFWNTGIKVESKEAADILAAAGCTVERHGSYALVKVPAHVVEECIQAAPRTAIYYGRIPEADFIAEPNRVGHSTFGECIQIIDPVTRQVRKSTKKDLGQVTLVCDYLDEISVMERPLCSGDQNPATQPLHNLEAMLSNTAKHIFIGAGGNARNCSKMVEMAAASIGGSENFRKRPNLTIFVCPTSPLMLVKECCEVIIEAARRGAGVAIIPMALAGATSSVTLAGTLITHNVEVLSALILAQLTVKGTTCTYCSMSTIMDLKRMVSAVGAPEHGILSAGAVKLAQFYRLPSWVGGGVSDSKLPDAQSGYEYTMNALLGSLAGANIVYGAGALEMGLTIDYAKLVMDAEMIRYIHTILRGFDFSEDALALDLIHQVGPSGEFLTSEHTHRHMREQSQPKLFDRRTRDAWKELGGKEVTERAYEEAIRIMSTHKPAPLPSGAAETIHQIIFDYESELGIIK